MKKKILTTIIGFVLVFSLTLNAYAAINWSGSEYAQEAKDKIEKIGKLFEKKNQTISDTKSKYEGIIADKDEAILDKEKQVEEKEEEIVDLEKRISEKDEKIEQLKEEKENSINNLENQLDQAKKDVKELNDLLGELIDNNEE